MDRCCTYEDKIKKFGEGLLRAQREFNVEFLECNFPTLEMSGNFSAHIKVKNTGNKFWNTPSQSKNPVNLSYRWKYKEDYLKDTGTRTALPRQIQPEETAELDIEIKTPTQLDDNVLEIDMLKENEFWFSDRGSIPLRIYPDLVKKK